MPAGSTSTFFQLPLLPTGEQLPIKSACDDEQRNELGGVVWPCAAALCRFLASDAADVCGDNVLELGSGTGACGLYAAGLGASRVLLTDVAPSLARLQAENLEGAQHVLPADHRVDIKRFEWGTAAPAGPWQWVLGSDLTYATGQNEVVARALATTLAELLAVREAARPPRVIMAHQHRHRKHGQAVRGWDGDDPSLQLFARASKEQGLVLSQLSSEDATEEIHALLKEGGHPVPRGSMAISIIEVSRSGSDDIDLDDRTR